MSPGAKRDGVIQRRLRLGIPPEVEQRVSHAATAAIDDRGSSAAARCSGSSVSIPAVQGLLRTARCSPAGPPCWCDAASPCSSAASAFWLSSSTQAVIRSLRPGSLLPVGAERHRRSAACFAARRRPRASGTPLKYSSERARASRYQAATKRGVERDRLLVVPDGPPQASGGSSAQRWPAALEVGVVRRQVRGRRRLELRWALSASATSSALATLAAMSPCTWNTSVSAASNGCSSGCGGAWPGLTSTSSGVTRTRLAPPALVPPHRGGEQVVRAQLARDLRGRLGGVAILVRAAARDDRRARRCRTSLDAHLVAHAVGEVGVARVAQVLEGKHRHHAGAARCLRARVPVAPGEEGADAHRGSRGPA